jgi:hypothetical protein
MAHALAIVVGDNWEALMQPHCIHKEDGTEGDGQFDWCERGGRFGKPLKFRVPQSRGGLLRFLGATTHTAQGRRSQIDIDSLREQFAFAVVSDEQWHDPESFEEARQLIETAPGDPVMTAVDYHL